MRFILALFLILPFAYAQQLLSNASRNISSKGSPKLNQPQLNTTKINISQTNENAIKSTEQEPTLTEITGPIVAPEEIPEIETELGLNDTRQGRGRVIGGSTFPEPNCKNLLNADGSFNIPSFNIDQNYGEKLRCFAILSYCVDAQMPKLFEQLNTSGGFFRPYVKANSKAFMAKAKDSIIISFAGTDDLQDVLDDVRLGHYFSKVNGVRIAKGFYDYVDRIYVDMTQNLTNLVQRGKPTRIILTGHSLGGAAAQIAAYRISFDPRINSISLEIPTFGQPAAGNAQFAQRIEEITNGKHVRFVNSQDPISSSFINERQIFRCEDTPEKCTWVHTNKFFRADDGTESYGVNRIKPHSVFFKTQNPECSSF
ncbi:uncharacterized protein VTP21DRAFT_9021 [Calcarisporiella thermophila]|uniref:uncharacterized protein n=1 Tax=Calcarisporiella thermophila TaxID=911321 RepID=UPI0037425E54